MSDAAMPSDAAVVAPVRAGDASAAALMARLPSPFVRACVWGALALGLGHFDTAERHYAHAVEVGEETGDAGLQGAIDDIRATRRFLALVTSLDVRPDAIARALAAHPQFVASGGGLTPDVSIIVPVYCRLDETLRCLASLARITTALSFEVLVSDDASFDGTGAALETHLGAVARVLRNPVQRSFAANCNGAVDAARGRFVVLLNNDTVVQPGFLAPLIEPLMRHPNAALVGNLQLAPDAQQMGGVRVDHAGIWFDATGVPRHRHLGGSAPQALSEAPREMTAVTGCCLAFERQTFTTLGGFDAAFANGFEDVDLCLRAGSRGRTVMYTPASVVYHFGAKSEGRFASESANASRFLARWRSHLSLEDEPSFPTRHDLRALLPIDGRFDRDDGPETKADRWSARLPCGGTVDALIAPTATAAPPSSPRLSVVIATRNRADTLGRCLRAWRERGGAGGDFEIVVVDDGSADETRAILERSTDATVRFITQSSHGLAQARAVGIRASRGKWVLLTRDDATPCAGLLDAHLRAHTDATPERVVMGLARHSAQCPATSFADLASQRGFHFGPVTERDGATSLAPFEAVNVSFDRAFLLRCLHDADEAPDDAALALLAHGRGATWSRISDSVTLDIAIIAFDAAVTAWTRDAGTIRRLLGARPELGRHVSLPFDDCTRHEDEAISTLHLRAIVRHLEEEAPPPSPGDRPLLHAFAAWRNRLRRNLMTRLWREAAEGPPPETAPLLRLTTPLPLEDSPVLGAPPHADDTPERASQVLPICFYATALTPRWDGFEAWGGQAVAKAWALVRTAPDREGRWHGPRLPSAALGLYDPADAAVRRRQGELARAAGIHGFCYDHRWRAGQREGERVLDAILADRTPDLPFMLNWMATPIADVAHADARRDHVAHFERLARFFDDPRYIRVNDCPVLLITQAGTVASLPTMLDTWRALAREHDLAGLHLVAALTGDPADTRHLGCFDAACEMMPSHALALGLQFMPVDGVPLVSGEEAWKKALGAPRLHPVQYRGAFAAHNDTSCRGERGLIHAGLSVSTFRNLLAEQARRTQADPALPAPLLFVSAWNAWADGCALEPDLEGGSALLDVVAPALHDAAAQPQATPLYPRTAAASAEVIPDRPDLLIVRVADFEPLDPSWDRLAADLALAPGVTVIDCVPNHHHLPALALAADVLVLAALDAEIADLVIARHADPSRVNLLEPDTLRQRAEKIASMHATNIRLLSDLLIGLRHAVDGLQVSSETDLPSLGLDTLPTLQIRPRTEARQALAFYQALATRGSTPTSDAPKEDARTLPPLPFFCGSHRHTLAAGDFELSLEACLALAGTPDFAPALDRLIARAPRYLDAQRRRLRLLNERGQCADVERATDDVLAWAPHDSRVRTERAEALARQGRHDEARAALHDIVASNPQQVRAWVLLLRLVAGRPEAADTATRAAAANPSNHALGLVAAGALPANGRRAFLQALWARLSPTLTAREEAEVRDAFVSAGLNVEPVAGRSMALHDETPPVTEGTFGVNLSGYFRAVTGLGQGARAVAQALQAGGIAHVLDNWSEFSPAPEHSTLTFSSRTPYRFNLIHANADELSVFIRNRGRGRLQGHYNIGIWNWELSTFPEMWTGAFAHLDEIWAASAFARDSIASASPVPVLCMPYAVKVPQTFPRWMTRGVFGLPRAAFCFLFAYDAYSYTTRKNPLAVVRAFRRAFGGRPDAHLLVKVLHAHHDEPGFHALRHAAGGAANIRIMTSPLSREEMYGLTALCDAYVALHRSEGFGFPLAEAMAFGKPVIATGYSSNVDFMNNANSLLVEYRLVPIERDDGPYRRGAVWADADIDHAAACMRRLVDEPGLARRLGDQARLDMARDLSDEAVGRRIRARLEEIAARA